MYAPMMLTQVPPELHGSVCVSGVGERREEGDREVGREGERRERGGRTGEREGRKEGGEEGGEEGGKEGEEGEGGR